MHILIFIFTVVTAMLKGLALSIFYNNIVVENFQNLPHVSATVFSGAVMLLTFLLYTTRDEMYSEPSDKNFALEHDVFIRGKKLVVTLILIVILIALSKI